MKTMENEQLFLCVSVDERGEFQMLTCNHGGRVQPVMSTDRENFRKYCIPFAERFAKRNRKPYRVLHFTQCQDVTAEFRSQAGGETG